jgi:hypothetical protein
MWGLLDASGVFSLAPATPGTPDGFYTPVCVCRSVALAGSGAANGTVKLIILNERHLRRTLNE